MLLLAANYAVGAQVVASNSSNDGTNTGLRGYRGYRATFWQNFTKPDVFSQYLASVAASKASENMLSNILNSTQIADLTSGAKCVANYQNVSQACLGGQDPCSQACIDYFQVISSTDKPREAALAPRNQLCLPLPPCMPPILPIGAHLHLRTSPIPPPRHRSSPTTAHSSSRVALP